MRPINRPEPQLGAEHMKTYEIRAPLTSHWRVGTCAEDNCAAYERGWRTTVDEGTDLGRGQAYYIRKQSGRKFVETRDDVSGTLTIFEFESGQKCFREHQVRLDRTELFIVRDGDFRGNPRGSEALKHARPADWVDDFAEHQATLADRLERG